MLCSARFINNKTEAQQSYFAIQKVGLAHDQDLGKGGQDGHLKRTGPSGFLSPTSGLDKRTGKGSAHSRFFFFLATLPIPKIPGTDCVGLTWEAEEYLAG